MQLSSPSSFGLPRLRHLLHLTKLVQPRPASEVKAKGADEVPGRSESLIAMIAIMVAGRQGGSKFHPPLSRKSEGMSREGTGYKTRGAASESIRRYDAAEVGVVQYRKILGQGFKFLNGGICIHVHTVPNDRTVANTTVITDD